MPPNKKSIKRVEKLFLDIKRIENQPLADIEPRVPQPLVDNPGIRRELETLGARILELEAQLKESEGRASAQAGAVAARPADSSLYEKERVGYSYSSENSMPLRMTTLSDSKPDHAINAPLTASGQTIGEMQVEPPPERDWTPEESNLANAVAQQASLQIQNLRLLAATERARAEAEAATRRFMHESWDSYLDGIRNSERIGYAYDQASVTPVYETPAAGGFVQETVNVMEEQVGSLYLQPDPNRPLTDADRAMLTAIAKQVAQQVENIRLLADASRARAEAEEATRRLTRESWEAYASKKRDANFGVVYDLNDVVPLGDAPLIKDLDYTQSLTVRGEVIGHLAVSGGKEVSKEEAVLTSAIAERVSAHLETLRLAEEIQKRASEIEASERRFRAVSDTANDAIISADSRGHIVYFNKEAERIFGYSQQEAVGQSLTIIMPEKFKTPHERGMERYLQTKEPHIIGETVELIGRHKDGREFPIDLSLASWNAGDEIFFTALIRDITVRKQTEAALTKRAVELQAVARVSAAASTVLDPDELLQSVVDLTKERFNLYHVHIYLATDAWNTLLLAAGAGETGKAMVAQQHAIAYDAEKSIVARAFRERSAVIVNDALADPSFLPNPALPETHAEIAVPLIVGDKVLGVFDVQSETANRFTEEDANIYTTLAVQVAIALQNARLYVEQSATVTQLRELDRLKSSFLANMSHELRTPLNSILGFADVMLEELDGPLTENMNTDLGLIQKNGQHLLHLINDVLDMAKIEAGRMNLSPEKFVVHDILEEVTSITSTLASEKNLALFIEQDSDREAEINADRIRLRQIMINLINNAIKFTEKGKIALRVAPQGENILITVRDTGIGVPSDKLEAIFQEFTQVDTSSTRKAGGTGLGLPISRRLVEMHGGRLWAESSGINGEGSTFFVELPIEARFTEPVEKTTK